MQADIDRPVNGGEVVLLEPTDPEKFRALILARFGGIEAFPAAMRARIPTPEEDLKTLLAKMEPGDELWLARSAIYDPNALIGNVGIAIVRNGNPIWYRVGWHH